MSCVQMDVQMHSRKCNFELRECSLSDTTVGVACCAHRYITRGSKVEWGGESERRGKADEGDGVITPPSNAHREDTHIGKTRTPLRIYHFRNHPKPRNSANITEFHEIPIKSMNSRKFCVFAEIAGNRENGRRRGASRKSLL